MRTLLTIVFILLTCSFSYSQDGVFDNTFSIDGVKLFSSENQNTRGSNILHLLDGSILIAANKDFNGVSNNRTFFISKLLPNGDVDTSFGINGQFSIASVPNGFAFFYTMILQDNRILFLCTIDSNITMGRINQNGTYDTTFGDNGTVSFVKATKIALKNDGKIIAIGQYYEGNTTSYSQSVYSYDGVLDTSVGINGVVQTDITPYRFDMSNSVQVQADNKTIVVGASYETLTQRNAVIARFNEDGSLDNNFGTNGVILTQIGVAPGHAIYNEVSIQDNGKIVVCGNMEYSSGPGGFGGTKPTVVRYNNDGTLDNEFGNNGKVILNTTLNANDVVYALKIQPDGKIIIGGSVGSFPSIQSYFYLTRLDTSGNIDTTFGINGAFLTNFSTSETNYLYDIDLQENGKILAIGASLNATTQNSDAVVCRLKNDSLLNSVDFNTGNDILVYPNPTKDNLFISGIDSDSKIEIYNYNGQRCNYSNKSISSKEIKIDIQNLPNGIYLLSITKNSKTKYEKIIKS